MALTIKLNCGRLAAATGHYAIAEQEFNEIIQRAGPGSGPAEEPLCLALLHKALLYKSFSRFEGAEPLCQQALARRCAELSPEHRDLLPYYVALTAIQLEAGKLEKAKTTVDRAIALCATHKLEATLLGAQARHQRALVHFCCYQATADPAEAEAADRLWKALLPLQAEHAWRLEQAHTFHYLSRLKYLQWRHKLEQAWHQWRRQQSEDYRRLQSAYNRDYEQLQQRLAAYRGDKQKYEAAADVYARRQGAFEERQRQYRGLLEWYTTLEHTENGLRALRQDLSARQSALQQAYRDCVAGGGRDAGVNPPAMSALATKSADPLLADADRLAEQAVRRLAEIHLYPNLQYAAICNRAEILRVRAGNDATLRRQAAECLSQAIDLLEQPRLAISAKDAVRAEFLARYAGAFDLLVAWLVEDHQPEEALVYAELCRNRSFLDGIRADGVPLTDSLTQADRHLIEREQRLLSRGAVKAAELGAFQETASSRFTLEQRRRQDVLRGELDEIYRQYSQNRREICAHSPIYQHVLAKPLTAQEVRTAVAHWINAGEVAIYYHLGTMGSFVFLIGAEPKAVEVFRLQSSALASAPQADVSADSINQWVQVYLDALKSPGSLEPAIRLGGSRLVGIAEALVSRRLRDRLRSMPPPKRSHLTIFPDGKLYQLPFEALILDVSSPVRYLVDDLSPRAFTYAPSLMVLDALRSRRSIAAEGAGPAVSLAHPDLSTISPSSGPVARHYLELFQVASLRDLPRSEEESNAIVRALGRDRVEQLLGKDATKARLSSALNRRPASLLHLATHGVASEAALQTEAALVLALPPNRQTDPADNGFLTLAEIYRLPLAHCELAVLSACNTNVGQQASREMGLTLSRAFLSAGVKRVVASQWSVADDATARLIARFFDEMGESLRKGHPCDYSVALQAARHHVRHEENGRWAGPHFSGASGASGTSRLTQRMRRNPSGSWWTDQESRQESRPAPQCGCLSRLRVGDQPHPVENPCRRFFVTILRTPCKRTGRGGRTVSLERPTAAKYLLAGRNDLDAPVRVALRAHLGFSREIDRQLRRLVVRWSHVASPWSRGIPLGPGQPGAAGRLHMRQCLT